jgi:uncharacterized peroxidase-related enzyme
MVDRIAEDWRTAELDEATAALMGYAERLTRSPAAMTAADIVELRAVGWDERAINDAIQVVSYFNYINRVADGLGLPPEDWIDELGNER